MALVIDNNSMMGEVNPTPVPIGIMCRRYKYGTYGWQPDSFRDDVRWTQFDDNAEMDRILQEEIRNYGERYDTRPMCSNGRCNQVVRHFKEDCQPGGRTSMRIVQMVLKELIEKYRAKMRFSVVPVSNFHTEVQVKNQFQKQFEQWGMPHINDKHHAKYSKEDFKLDVFTQQASTISSKYYDGASDSELSQLLHNIDLLKPQMTNHYTRFGSTVNLMDALPKIAKDVVMKGQQYRCQKSFLVLLSNAREMYSPIYNQNRLRVFDLKNLQPTDYSGGVAAALVPSSWYYDGKFELNPLPNVQPEAGWDGYFDMDRIRGPLGGLYGNFHTKYFLSVCEDNPNNVCRLPSENYPSSSFETWLAYYTQRLASKNFGSYIYKNDYYRSCIKVSDDSYMGYHFKRYEAFTVPSGASTALLGKRIDNFSEIPIPTLNSPDFFCTGQPTLEHREKDDAGEAWDAINPQTGRPYTQTAETFTIGMGLKFKQPGLVPGAADYDEDSSSILYFAATPAGKYDPVKNPDGRFYDIDGSYEELLASFDDIFRKIYESTTAVSIVDTVAATVGLSSTSEGDTSVTAKVDTGSWSSQICIHNRGEDPLSCAIQPSYTNRQLVINDGKNSYLYAPDLAINGMDNTTFKIKDNFPDPSVHTGLDPTTNNNKTEWRDGLLTWLARAKEDDKIKTVISNIANSWFILDYRNRTDIENFGSSRNVGDILNNPLISMGDPVEGMRHQKYLITSANDGMVYVFGATKDKNQPYDLKFNYMPLNMQRQSNDNSDLNNHYYQDLTDNQYGQFTTKPHRYLLNGGMVVQQTDDRGDGIKQTFMVSTMGQGGRGAFAINIGGKDILSRENIGIDNMNSPDWYKNLQLFRTSDGTSNKFGYTVGMPAVARIRVNYGTSLADTKSYKHNIVAAAFISNGYNYSDTLAKDTERKQSAESALYVYNVLGADVGTDGYKPLGNKGDLLKKIVAEGGRGGLSSPAAFDVDDDNIADIVYAGDYAGNLFRFDIRNPDPSTWKGVKIFAAGKPITAAPLVVKADNQKLVVVFGTGSDLYDEDLESRDQQAIYGIYDDYNDAYAQVSKTDLLQQNIGVNGPYRTISKNKFDPASHKGWYINLDPNDGERVVSNFSRLLTTGIIPTRIYEVKKELISAKDRDPCSSEIETQNVTATTRMVQFNLRTGSGLTEKSPHIVFDKNNPLGIVSKDGLVGFEILSEIIQNIGGTGNWRPLGDVPPSSDRCLEKLPVAATTEGLIESEDIKNVHCARVTFKRLSWREIKEGYNK